MTANDAPSSASSASRPDASPRRPGHGRRLSTGRSVAYTLVLILAVVYLLPLLVMVNTSLRSPRAFMLDPAAIASELTVSNFAEAWEAANFATYIANTLLYTVVSTGIYLVLVIFVAFPLARNYMRGSRIIYLLYVIALFLPNSLIPQFQLMLGLGLYNTRFGYILLTLTGGLGVLILYSYIKSIPIEAG